MTQEIHVLVEKEKRDPTDEMLELIDPKNPRLLAEMEGAKGLAMKLNSDLEKGLSNNAQAMEKQIKVFGTNVLPEPVSYTFLQFVW